MALDRRELLAIFVGGCIGAILRAALVELFDTPPDAWPWATFVVNLGGAFALGYFVTRLQEGLPLSAYGRPLLGTGFCGALTTFSAMQLELVRMFEAGESALAIGYLVSSMACGFFVLLAATNLVRRAGWSR